MDDNRKELSIYRLSEVEQCIKDAKNAYDNGGYKTAANRSYYAMFHSIRALLAIEKVDYKKHSAVISHFRREYIKTDIFPMELSDYLGEAFEVRGKSDYDDFYIISKEEVQAQINHAEKLYNAIGDYIKSSL